MPRMTITHETNYVSDETGYSAWVHVHNGTKDDHAHHVGYYPCQFTAMEKAKNAAEGIARAVRMTGRKPKVVSGTHLDKE